MVGSDRISIEEAHTLFAKSSNAKVWDLLGKDKRTTLEDEELITAAHASLYHWSHVGTNVNLQRAHWLISHVLLELNQAEQSLSHAERCMRITNSHSQEMKDFDFAYAHEALARVHAHLGGTELAQQHLSKAIELGEQISDDEDRGIFMNDLQGGEWAGVA